MTSPGIKQWDEIIRSRIKQEIVDLKRLISNHRANIRRIQKDIVRLREQLQSKDQE